MSEGNSGLIQELRATISDAEIEGEVTMSRTLLGNFVGVMSDAVILVGVIREMERQHPTAEGARLAELQETQVVDS